MNYDLEPGLYRGDGRSIRSGWATRDEADEADDMRAEAPREARSDAEEALLSAIRLGQDIGMKTEAGRYVTTDFITECASKDARAILLGACSHALNGNPEAAMQGLREFLAMAAQEYAEDNWESHQ